MVATLLLQSEPTTWPVRSIWGQPVAILCVSLLFLIIVLLPFGILLKRTGHHPAWCFFFIIPCVNLIALWILAFKRWPIDRPNP